MLFKVSIHFSILISIESCTHKRPCDGTYCRSVHIVVGDNMYRPSLHILSSIGTYCRRQKSYTCTYCRRRQYVPNLTAHIVAPQMLLLKDFFYSFVNVIGVFITKTCLVGYFMQRDSDGTYCRHVHIVATDNVSYPYISCCRPAVCIVDGCNIIRVDIYCRWRI